MGGLGRLTPAEVLPWFGFGGKTCFQDPDPTADATAKNLQTSDEKKRGTLLVAEGKGEYDSAVL